MSEKILIVDDEEIIRDSLTFILRKEGYEVDEAENGVQALEKVMSSSVRHCDHRYRDAGNAGDGTAG